MIIERVTFKLKFGKAREAITLWKELLEEAKKSNKTIPHMRILSDLSGPSYTLQMEMHLKSFMDIGPAQYEWMTNEKFKDLYQQIIPLCESASKDYFRIEAEV